LCALSVENVGKDWLKITDAKTEAGTREVPIHSRIRDTLKRLVGKCTTGFVIEGLDVNKHGQKGNAIGKRFTRLKAKAGFGETKAFHSIRHTVSNMLEVARIAENLGADMLGHRKNTMTYGLYSGRGATRDSLPAALANLRYPSPL
jgi:integrase